ncbi:Uma2 family endonuclease [Nocardia sp. XZ_19_231]|uniref:Uma2 family endonuclease n=1 Tax=Nocardia sp. XZ_19_231 TaxID=2769252 RepID=UPI0018903E0F|nr:Uma2 family endonuclease [Nocardia sp. XZ_19_231]
MHEQITAAEYDTWSEEQCAGIEIVDGMVVGSPSASKLLVVEVVSPGSETTDRIVKVDQYAKAGIAFYWRIEQAANGVPLIYTYILDPATGSYRTGDMFTGAVDVSVPFPVEIDLGKI